MKKGTNFSLQSSSPCINAGVSVGLTQDINGNPISGNPDMGAYEYYIAPYWPELRILRKVKTQ